MATVNIGLNTGNSGGLEDNYIDSKYTDINIGAYTKLSLGIYAADEEMRGLLRFDLSSLPAGATCTAAVLYLYDENPASRTADTVISIYQVSDANGDWVEGTTGWGVQAGSSCWQAKKYTIAAWAGSNGLSTPTTDYVTTLLGSDTFSDGTSGYKNITLNADGRSVIQSWFGDATNNGLFLKTAGTSGDYDEITSSDGADGQRPYLAITYTTVDYTKGNYADLPTDDAELEDAFTGPEVTAVESDDDSTYADQSATGQYAIFEFKENATGKTSVTATWDGKSSLAPSSSTVYLQVYNRSGTPAWETIDSENGVGANTDFTLQATLTDLTNYKDGSSIIAFRVYQLVA